MTFEELFDQAIDLLRRRGRVTSLGHGGASLHDALMARLDRLAAAKLGSHALVQSVTDWASGEVMS